MDYSRGRRGQGGSARGGRGRGSSHVDPFHDESDTTISQRSSRAGLGSSSRQQQHQPPSQQQQQADGKFRRHTQQLNAQAGRVPKFLADIVAASSQSVRRQLPTSIVDGLARADDEEDDRAEAGNSEAQQRRDGRIAREMEQREKDQGSDRPVRQDELPAIANLAEYAHQTAELTELLGTAPPLQQAGSAEEEQKAEKAEAESDLPAGRRGRLEDVRADDVERATGQHAFRKSRTRAVTTAQPATQPASKKAKTASASKLSFDEDDV